MNEVIAAALVAFVLILGSLIFVMGQHSTSVEYKNFIQCQQLCPQEKIVAVGIGKCVCDGGVVIKFGE